TPPATHTHTQTDTHTHTHTAIRKSSQGSLALGSREMVCRCMDCVMELCKGLRAKQLQYLTRTEEDPGQAELVIIIIQAQSLEQSLWRGGTSRQMSLRPIQKYS